MPQIPLLEIGTDAFRVEIDGPVIPPSRLVTQAPGAKLVLDPRPGDPVAYCRYRAPDGARAWHPGQPGPSFFEDTNYRVTIEALKGSTRLEIAHRDPSLTENVVPVAGREHLRSGTVNFRRQVGLSRFMLRAGDERLAFTIEVFPTKIDYRVDYSAIINDLTGIARGLSLEYLRSTFRTGSVDTREGGSDLEWLTLLRQQVDNLDRALGYIAAHPHRNLLSVEDAVRAEAIRRPTATTRRAVQRGLGSGPWISLPPIGSAHSILPSGRVEETLNTAEHRWLRQQLALVLHRLEDIRLQLRREREESEVRNQRVRRVEYEIAEISAMAGRLSRWLDISPLAEADGFIPPSFTSLVLIAQSGYREAYQALLSLRMALQVSGHAVELAIKDIDVLYESWCFVHTVYALCGLVEGRLDYRELIDVEDSGVRIRLRKGRRSVVRLLSEGRELRLVYNRTYDGLTGAQRPDIVFEFRHHGWPVIVIILDAKYRLDSSERYVQTFGSPGPPIDAVNALHRYRDAIVQRIASEGLGRPVVRGAVLFPLAAEHSEEFRLNKLWQSLTVLGIGAIPVLPGGTNLLEEWLGSVLSLGPADLADPGPPFLALEHKRGIGDEA